MNVNHGTLPCETVCESVESVGSVRIPWDDFMKPMV